MTRIGKLLIANRGEIASRVIRTARSLDIAAVAVFSRPDSGAPYVAEAAESVPLRGAVAEDTYLRADLLIDAALRTGADAVHPGYGFLSENADFAQACADAGLVFVGSPPDAIRAMGSKTSAKQLMAQAGVPVLPGLTVGAGKPWKSSNTAPERRSGSPSWSRPPSAAAGEACAQSWAPASFPPPSPRRSAKQPRPSGTALSSSGGLAARPR